MSVLHPDGSKYHDTKCHEAAPATSGGGVRRMLSRQAFGLPEHCPGTRRFKTGSERFHRPLNQIAIGVVLQAALPPRTSNLPQVPELSTAHYADIKSPAFAQRRDGNYFRSEDGYGYID